MDKIKIKIFFFSETLSPSLIHPPLIFLSLTLKHRKALSYSFFPICKTFYYLSWIVNLTVGG